MQRYIFIDLDDTLFQTLRKCESTNQNLAARAYLPDNSPNSYATEKQQWLWEWIQDDFKIVPVTGRDFAAFNRVSLPFSEEVVLNHGAVILDRHRQPDPLWMNNLHSELPRYLEKLQSLWTAIENYCKKDSGFKLQLVRDFETTWYGVIKHNDNESRLMQLLTTTILNHSTIEDGSLYWHLNGNNLAVLPKIINKESAVAFLLARYQQQYGSILTFAAGDSHSDAAFLALCDYALLPKNTQLFNTLLT